MSRAVIERLAVLALGAGSAQCGAPPVPEPIDAACLGGTDLSWDGFAEGFFLAWCTSCHSPLLSGPARGGAPEGVDLATYDDVVRFTSRIAATSTGASPVMPPGGGPSEAQRADLATWLGCGMPGPPAAPALPCDGPTLDGDVTLSSATDVTDLCAAGGTVGGTVTVEVGGGLDCLCAVGGDLVITGAADAVSLSGLRTVAGALTVVDAPTLTMLSAPALEAVGSVQISGNPTLQAVDLSSLAAVDGALTLEADAVGGSLALDRLLQVGGDLRLAGLPRLQALALLRLETVGGDLVVSDVAAGSVDLGPILTIGGELRVDGSAGLADLGGLRQLTTVGGAVTLSDLPLLASFDGFGALRSVGGVLRLDDLIGLQAVPAVGWRGRALGGVEVSRVPSLATLGPVGWETIDGSVLVCDTSLTGLDGLADVEGITGDLTICRNASLVGLEALVALLAVDGDLVVEDNPQLPTAAAEAFAAGIVVGGTIRIAGNG